MKELAEGIYTGELLKKVTTENFIVSSTQYLQSNQEGSLHSHENPHACLLYQGSDFEFREGVSPYERRTGNIFFYEAGEPHRTIATDKLSKNINIEFRDDKSLKKNFSIDNLSNCFKNNIDSNLLSIKILNEFFLNDELSKLSLELLCFELLDCSNEIYPTSEPNWVNLLKDHLNDNWQSQYSLSELSNLAGVHPITISKNFRKYFYCTYGEYIRKLKIKNSISMIKNTKLSLTEIAHTCGFSDQSHFTRNFKVYTGFLPKQFQRI